MRITRLVTGLVTVGLAAAGPVLLSAAPAQAATVPSTVTVDPLTTNAITYGDDLYISGKVTAPSGNTPNSPSTVSLQVSTPSNPTWTTVATDDSAGYFSFSDVVPQTNATYKVVFPGGTEGFGSSANTMAPAESAPIAISVARKVDARTKDLNVLGKVTPDFAKKKIKILQIVGHKKTKKYATVKTDKKGKFSFRAPKKNKFKFILMVPADANYAAVANQYIVHVY